LTTNNKETDEMRPRKIIFLAAMVTSISATYTFAGWASPAAAAAVSRPPGTNQSGNSTITLPGDTKTGSREPDVIYVPTPPAVVEQMLKVAKVGATDVIYDLGCGDGRIVITAARTYGASGVGIDIDPQRIQEANENAREAGVTDRVRFLNEDLFEADISKASVVTLYLLDSLNEKLRPKLLRELKPGTRIVSHDFKMGDWQPEQTIEMDGHSVYFWTVPARGKPAAKARKKGS
jgi:SAM-dependent methyltransferase